MGCWVCIHWHAHSSLQLTAAHSSLQRNGFGSRQPINNNGMVFSGMVLTCLHVYTRFFNSFSDHSCKGYSNEGVIINLPLECRQWKEWQWKEWHPCMWCTWNFKGHSCNVGLKETCSVLMSSVLMISEHSFTSLEKTFWLCVLCVLRKSPQSTLY